MCSVSVCGYVLCVGVCVCSVSNCVWDRVWEKGDEYDNVVVWNRLTPA